MDNNEIVIDIESMGNTTPLPLLPSSKTHERDKGVPIWSKPLFDAIKHSNWNAIHDILDRVPEAINGPIGPSNKTPLYVAIHYNVDTHIIERLIHMTPTEKLTYSDENSIREPYIHLAVSHRQFSIVKLLTSKNPALLQSLDYERRTPVHTALCAGQMEMANYLLKIASTTEDEDFELTETAYIDTLMYAIKVRQYDFIYSLIRRIPKLHDPLWNWLVEECDDFPCRSRLNILQSFIYSRIHMDDDIVSESLTREWKKANSRFYEIESPKHQDSQVSRYSRVGKALRCFAMLVLPIESVRLTKLKHHQTHEIVKQLGFSREMFSREDCRAFCSAVQNGNSDIVTRMTEISPFPITYKDDDGNNAIQLAITYRNGKTLSLLCDGIRFMSDPLISSLDSNDNNILHLVAKMPRQNHFGTNSGVVLQLQREFQWYKFVESMVPFDFKLKKNSDKKIPSEIFNEEHRDMLKSESEWMTSMANSCMVAGSLIAAVVFAAAITLPGGNKDDGLPIFSRDGAFNVFALSVAFALVSSLTAVVTFLSIFTTRFTVENFQYDLPNRLILGLLSLLLSVTFLMIAFCTTIHLLFKDDYNWIIYPTIVVSFIPVFFFAYLQLPSLLNIIKSTYGHEIFKNDNVVVFQKKRKGRFD